MKTSSFGNQIKEMLLMALMLISIASCSDDPIVKDHNYNAFSPDGSLTFSITVPGYALPTRATGNAEDIDAPIDTLHLYLFDEKGGFIGIVEADKDDDANALDPGEKDQIIGEGTNAEGSYKANIPQNTDIIHFVANAPQAYTPGHIDLNRYKGMREEEVFLTMLTTQHVYWGTSTYNELTTAPNPVVLYRNYAKVRYRLTEQTTTVTNTPYIAQINGWTLCNASQNSLIAPYDEKVSVQHYHFSLTDNSSTADAHRYAAVPVYDQRLQLSLATPLSVKRTASDGKEIYTDNQGKALSLFDHTVEAYSESKFLNSTSDARVFAIFHITTAINDGSTTTYEHKYYKILFLKNVKDGASQTFDIKRNHIYTIRFEGINPDLGWDSFADAVAGPPANVSEITVEETLPEVQSSNATLRVVNGTVRYIDDLTTRTGTTTDGNTSYPVNDLRIYYSGTDGASEGETSKVLKVEWVSDECSWTGNNDDTYQPEKTTLVCKKTNDPNGAYTHTISFDADAFTYGDNGLKHYKEGLIRITELLNDGVLTRYIRVYIGDPVSFRPLLISSDIPAMTDERITVAFTVPDSFYLPTTLYPIEVRFGSDQVDVEKNLYTSSMKVDLVSTDYDDNLLQYTNVVNGTTQDTYNWYANGQADDSWKDWGYKYTYTIETPADSGEHRITLRTVYEGMGDFSVVMEGLSTVLLNGTGDVDNADIFNTRELKFNVLSETTNDEARRIMLDNGLYDTRLTTAYVNISKSDNATSVSIPYTLGHFDTETNNMTSATLSTGVNLWVYYHPEDLTPSGTWATLNNDKPFVDAEGNHFAKIENSTSAKGTLTFTITEDDDTEVKNSLVFITARSGKDDVTGTHPYGGSYNSSAKFGDEDYVYTGVNAEENAWRSASALVSVLSNWKFNPAPTEIADNNFEYADEMERDYGVSIYKTDYDFFVRIDRPIGTSGINLSINTGGNLQLIEQVDVSKYTLDAGYYQEETETWDNVSTTVRRSTADTDGNIRLTLTADQSPYCILRFRPLHYDHSGTITFTDITSSAIYDNTAKNTLKITHSPITIVDHKYMWRDDYMLKLLEDADGDGNADNVVSDDQFYENLRVDANTAGQEFVVRLYFPNSIKERSSDKDENDNDQTFSFKFTGNGAKVINPTGTGKANFYTVDDEGLVTVTDKPISITHSDISCAYVDLFLSTTESVGTENFRITTGNDLLFYRYTLGEFSTRTECTNGKDPDGKEKVKYQISTSNSTSESDWMTITGGTDYFNTSDTRLAKIWEAGKTFFLKVTLLDWDPKNPNDKDKQIDLTLKTSGFKVTSAPTGSIQSTSPDSEQKQYRLYTYRFDNATWSVEKINDIEYEYITLQLQTESTGLAEYIQLETRTDISDDNTDQGAILDRTTILMGTKTTEENLNTWELYFSKEKNRNGDNNLIFDVNAQVNDKQEETQTEYYPIKMNQELSISFYAPFDGLDITVGVSARSENANREYAIYQVTPTGETALHSNTTSGTTLAEHTYTLGKAGLYRLRGKASGDFYLYYIKLKKNRRAGLLNAVPWKANRLSNTPKANAAWGGEGYTFTAEDNAADITLSAFAEKLTLTLSNIQEEPFNMRLTDGNFSFLTPSGLVTELTNLSKTDTLTIVPNNGGVLKHLDKIQLDGESSDYYYKQDITLNLRPYVKLTHNLGTFETVQIDGQNHAQLSVGDEVTFTFTYMDNSIKTTKAEFRLSEWRDNSDVQNEFFTAILPAEWNKGELYSLNNPKGGDAQTFKLKATKAGGSVFQARGTTNCDVYGGDTLTGNFYPTGKLDNIYPKINITGVSITYTMGDETAEGVLPEDAVIGSGESYTLPTKNFTLYKEGYTLTGWSDGTTTYAPGATLENVTGNVTLTPVFTQNTVSLSDRSAEVTITWDFQQQNGAPTVGWEGTDGHIWVAQAEVNGALIDVKMDVSTASGKFNNADWSDWAQINGGTILTIPSCYGATVALESYSATATTTIAGDIINQATLTPTYTYSGTADEIDIVIGDGSYWRTVKVTLPVVEKGINIIPTTDSNPFDLTIPSEIPNGKLKYNTDSEGNPTTFSNIDSMTNGEKVKYKIRNGQKAYYQMSINASTNTNNVGTDPYMLVTLTDAAGTTTYVNQQKIVVNGTDWSQPQDYTFSTPALPMGDYEVTIEFKTGNGGQNSYTVNVFSMSFDPFYLKIGLGTYTSTVVYEDITVKDLDDESTIYSSGSNVSSSDWNTSTGLYHSEDQATYVGSQLGLSDPENGGGATIVLNKEIATNNYELTCRAMKTSGTEGFLIMFDYLDDNNRKWWNIGGWSNKIQTVETWTVGSYANNVTQWATDTDPKIVASNIWYDITIKVQNGQFTGSCVPASIGAPYRFDCTFDGTTVNRTTTPVSQDASAVWALDGSIGTPTLTGGAFSNNNMTYENFTQGSDNETVDGVKTDYVTFAPSTANTYTPITWSITPTTGLTFTPTRVSAKILRVGTDGGTVNVKVKNSDGTETTLASDIIPRRKGRNTVSGDTNEDPKHEEGNTVYDYIEYSVDASLATSNSFSFIIEVSIGSGKSVAISDVQIHGAVSGKLE